MTFLPLCISVFAWDRQRQTPSGGGRQACLHARGKLQQPAGPPLRPGMARGQRLVCLPGAAAGSQPACTHGHGHHAPTDASIYEITSKIQDECR